MTPSRPSVPPLPAGVRAVAETDPGFGLPIHVHPEWAEAFPWLVQGTTGRGDPARPFDMAVFGDAEARPALERWRALGDRLEMSRIVHGRQVHGSAVRVHDSGPPGLQLIFDTDGHATRTPGVLLAVATADCVPVTIVHPGSRSIAIVHAGWRGTAGGIVERGIDVLVDRFRLEAGDLALHAGPAICGTCYEVGPEVHESLGLDAPPGPLPVDLRAVVARRAVEAGVPTDGITVSGLCTRCRGSPFFSHRGGCLERQVSFVGVRE